MRHVGMVRATERRPAAARKALRAVYLFHGLKPVAFTVVLLRSTYGGGGSGKLDEEDGTAGPSACA
jgi:hypothetical protein